MYLSANILDKRCTIKTYFRNIKDIEKISRFYLTNHDKYTQRHSALDQLKEQNIKNAVNILFMLNVILRF